MFERIRIVAVRRADGGVEIVYAGTDAASADRIFEAAGSPGDAVEMYVFPQRTKFRQIPGAPVAASPDVGTRPRRKRD